MNVWYRTLQFLDDIYHKSGDRLPLRWVCDAYDAKLGAKPMPKKIDAYALRCPVCEGLDYPGLSHNTDAEYCTHHE
jgi:hypothetical protein